MAAQRSGGKSRRRRKPRPPWNNLLGGKPIERDSYVFGERVDISDVARQIQHARLLELLQHYNIKGGDTSYPFHLGRVAEFPWYSLALAIASDVDESLKIVDGRPPGRTTKRWRGGVEGRVLLSRVRVLKKVHPKWSVRRCLIRIRQLDPTGAGTIQLNQLANAYDAAKARYHKASL